MANCDKPGGGLCATADALVAVSGGDFLHVAVGGHNLGEFSQGFLAGAGVEEDGDVNFVAHGFGGGAQNRTGKNGDH